MLHVTWLKSDHEFAAEAVRMRSGIAPYADWARSGAGMVASIRSTAGSSTLIVAITGTAGAPRFAMHIHEGRRWQNQVASPPMSHLLLRSRIIEALEGTASGKGEDPMFDPGWYERLKGALAISPELYLAPPFDDDDREALTAFDIEALRPLLGPEVRGNNMADIEYFLTNHRAAHERDLALLQARSREGR